MKYRLLIEIGAADFIQTLTDREQLQVRRFLDALKASPSRFVDFQEVDETGRLLDVHVASGFAYYFWDDFTDRHVKVMRVCRADF